MEIDEIKTENLEVIKKIKKEPQIFELYASVSHANTEYNRSTNECCSHEKELDDLRAESRKLVQLLIMSKAEEIKTLENENKKLREKEKRILSELQSLKEKHMKQETEQKEKENKLILEINSLKEKLKNHENLSMPTQSANLLEQYKVNNNVQSNRNNILKILA